MPLAAGTRLGPYEILQSIGAGGMGEVYRARDVRLTRDVAVKILPADVARDPERLDRFEREARASAALNHPNIIATFDIGQDKGLTYVVMEVLEGATLRHELTAHPPTHRKAIDWTIQVANGLAAAHARGIVHRDIKPENLFVTTDGRVKILDFGIARFTAAETSATEAVTLAAGTEAGKVLGTAGYMSPEQVRGDAIDARSDIFSLGAVLYEMLEGKRAFSGDTAVETMHAILKEDPDDFTVGGEPVPGGLDRIVRRCLEKRPEDRFYSAHDLALSLEAVSGSRTQPVSGVAAPPRRRRALAWAVLTAVLTGAAAGGAGWWFGQRSVAELPRIRQVTVRRGTIDAARFSAAGDSIVYSARFAGALPAPFETHLKSPEARQIGPANSILFAASNGGLALSLRPALQTNWFIGTLATLPPGASVARELAPRVMAADFVADGVAAVEYSGAYSMLHFPIGKVVYRTATPLFGLRAAPDGRALAFVERGLIVFVDAEGKRTETTARGTGLAWSPDGSRLWFSTGSQRGETTISSMSLGGAARAEWRMSGDVTLQDLSHDGRLLVRTDEVQGGTLVVKPGADEPVDLSWLDRSQAVGVSQSAGTVLLNDAAGVYLRSLDGSPALHLGDVTGRALSEDGRFVIAQRTEQQFQLVPVGVGTARDLPHPGIVSFFAWFHPDGQRMVFNGRQEGGTWRHFVMNLDGGGVTPVGPDNLEHYVGQNPLSNDGRWLLGFPLPERTLVVHSIDGGGPIPVQGVEQGEVVIRFADGDREIFVFNRDSLPTRVYRVNFRTGERRLLREFRPADATGIAGIPTIAMSADGRIMAFNYVRALSTLYEVSGLRVR